MLHKQEMFKWTIVGNRIKHYIVNKNQLECALCRYSNICTCDDSKLKKKKVSHSIYEG